MGSMGLLWAYRILAIVSGVVNAVSILLIRTRYGEARAKRLALDVSLLKRVDYLLILGFGAFSMLGYFILLFTLANYANVIGLDPFQASEVSDVFMLGQAVGRPAVGWPSDRFGRINITVFDDFGDKDTLPCFLGQRKAVRGVDHACFCRGPFRRGFLGWCGACDC